MSVEDVMRRVLKEDEPAHVRIMRDLYNDRWIRDYRRDPMNDRVGQVAYIVWMKGEES